jgi:hypothetical protein
MLFVAVVFAGGCNRDSGAPKLVPVQGTITLDGKPLPRAAITFVPIGNTEGSGASGDSDKDGKYEVLDRRGEKGVPVGEYNVSIVKPLPGGSEDSRGGAAALMAPSRIVVQKATVPAGGGTLDFPLKSRP